MWFRVYKILLFEYVHWCVSNVLTQVVRVLFFPGHPPKSLEVSNSLVGEKLGNAKSTVKQEKSKRLNLCCCFILLTWSCWPNESLRVFSLGSSMDFLKWLIFHLRQNETKKSLQLQTLWFEIMLCFDLIFQFFSMITKSHFPIFSMTKNLVSNFPFSKL